MWHRWPSYIIKVFKNPFFFFSPTFNLPLYKPCVKFVGRHQAFLVRINPRIKLMVSIWIRISCFPWKIIKGGNVFPGRMVVLSLSEPVTICKVFCPLHEITLHFLGWLGNADSKWVSLVKEVMTCNQPEQARMNQNNLEWAGTSKNNPEQPRTIQNKVE